MFNFAKPILLLFSILLSINSVLAQRKTDYGVLQRPNEAILYSFVIRTTHKIAVVCTQKNDKYIVYRFGTKDTVELQYPAVLNAASWKAFRYDGYSRTGVGSSYSLSFKNNNLIYEITEDWNGDESDAQIILKTDGVWKKTAGLVSSIDGTLSTLSGKANLIHNYYWDDNNSRNPN